ncbi:hypothetical protein C900_04159 [Fulvivirga imtechensis AK7]|uniref:Lipoprotein n=1 Tax=Fulvivirga imtechensis AK7 TaxID=1237149 RepID=L8K1I5_9BACT|nr:hypothetical protein [Fulvivirga imtechensis]ELR73307.1 hypothetical protein C900_04159 [Fulvivirga imtechensis AK7]
MKKKMMFSTKTMILAITLLTSLMYSCEEENTIAPDDQVTEADGLLFTPKMLATIQLTDGASVVFRSEADGVVYEEIGSSLGEKLQQASMLERFLALTNESVPVPDDIMALETDEALKTSAKQRGTVAQHPEVIYSEMSALTANEENSNCSGHSYYDTDAFGQFYRTYKGYTWGIAGATVYSSWKNGADKCKTVNLYLVNCSGTNTLSADTWYKNVWGNYVKQDVINVSPSNSRFWSKTYTSKRNRRVFVSGFGSGTFGGYVLFRDY